ncbi:DndE family protein [[Kitasatospora] papulosa]
MTWKIFAGQHGDLYLALLKQRCVTIAEKPSDEHVARELTVHLHRGIDYLGADTNMATSEGMITQPCPPDPARAVVHESPALTDHTPV